MINKPYRMAELEEIVGDLHSIDQTDIGLVALIGKVPVILPFEMNETLRDLVGKRIDILRLEGYKVRCLEGQM